MDVQVGTTLLLLAFAYDIFWVILQPLLLGGPSVMVEVSIVLVVAKLAALPVRLN